MGEKSIDIIKAPKGSLPEEPPPKRNRKEEELLPEVKRRDFSNIILGLGIVSVLALLGISGYFLFFGQKSEEPVEEISDEEVASSMGGEETTGSEATKETAKEEKSPFEALEETETSAVSDKAGVRIKVANGNGRTGEAGVMRNVLKQEGYQKIDIGNARHRYQTTIIYYAPGKEKEATEIEKIVSRKYQTSVVESKPVVGAIYDVVVALGVK